MATLQQFSGLKYGAIFLSFFVLALCLTVNSYGQCTSFINEHTGYNGPSPDGLHEGDRPSSSAKFTPAQTENINLAGKTVDEILEEMSLREKIGQLFFIASEGYFLNEESDDYQELIRKIGTYHVGGVIFFQSTACGQALLTNRLQEASELPLWISQDMEFGAAMRVENTTRLTPAMGIAATRNPYYAYLAGRITATEAKALGVNQIYAPVLDVNNNPRNPVINIRSFSSKPQLVSEFAIRFIEGVTSTGVIATAKHFPGHGDTDTDSHLALPVINKTYSEIEAVELAPFRAAIRAGVPSIMSAHIAFPQISQNPDRPSTLSNSVLEGILRDSLHFSGLVVTDALRMSGISEHYSPGEAAYLALKASADVLLLSENVPAAINYLRRAVESGKIAEERIDLSVRKLLTLKKEAGLFQDRFVDINNLTSAIHSGSNQRAADKIARASITLLKNEGNIIPLRASEYPHVLVLSVGHNFEKEDNAYLAAQMRRYHPNVRFQEFDEYAYSEQRQDIIEDARWADLIIIGSFLHINPADEQQYEDSQLEVLNRLPENTPAMVVSFGNPYAVKDLPSADVHLLAWDGSKLQMRAAVSSIFGANEINGKLPIVIPEMYAFGEGVRLPKTTLRFDEPETAGISSALLNKKISAIMHQGIYDSTFPGGVVAVVKDGKLVYQNGFGYHTYEKIKRTKPNAVFDLASLTKVVATTTAVMDLIDKGKIALDDHVSEYFEEFSEGAKSQITIRHLLLHSSGLPPFRIYVDELQERAAIVEAVKNEPLIYETGTRYDYSDLGFILLGEIVAQVSGVPLNEYVRNNFYVPLGMQSTFFNPKENAEWLVDNIPPAEIDTVYRHKTIQAEVHDERAWYMDGMAGHAGLFSSAGDLAIYAQMLLNKGTYGGERYLSDEIIDLFTARQSKFNNRGYGFDRKSLQGFSMAGSLSSQRTFGHTGFTGTSMWIDPAKNLAVILLTNDTWPYRSYGDNIANVRSNIVDAVISSFFKHEE